MHIGLLIYGDINTLSGGYLYDRKLVDYLRSQGDSVEIISLPEKPYLRSLLSIEIPEFIRVKTANDIKFDLLIQDELIHPFCLGINKKLKTLFACPIISLVHLLKFSIPTPRYKKVFIAYVEKKYLESVDGLLLNSQNTKFEAEKLLAGKLPEHIIAVPCADNFPENSSQNRKQNYADEENVLKILFVGNISRQKGLHVLIDAVAKLDDPGVSLTVVGDEHKDSAYMAEVRKKLASYKYKNQIVLKSRQSGEALQTIYQQHDVFVMPSVNEAYGIVYLEAMQFGLPVIATRQGGSKEFVRHGENGFLIDPADSKELAELIALLKNNRQKLQILSENAAETYKQHPRWQDSCEKIRKFLQLMVQDNQSSTDNKQ